ncbi:hypothetical protein IGI39_000972 [Enterococcus sp. AZ135]|uniref:HAD family hydrolase n=1 Tax=unclassified Enterococcus TaxID=2608891 RepID=UPI003F24C7E8
MIQGIVFDLDDTLYEQQAPFAAAIHSLFPSFPASEMKALFIRFRHYSDFHYMKSITGEWTLEKMRYERIRLALADFDFVPADADLDAFQTAYDHALQTISLPIEISSALDWLKEQKVPMGIITNGPVKRQEDKLNALQLANWFDWESILISDGVQIQKPDPRIFKLMEEHLALSPESLLYIGDSFDNDVIGAKAAGWSVWWFNHQGRDIPSGQTAIFDKEIKSFNDLNNALTNKKVCDAKS